MKNKFPNKIKIISGSLKGQKLLLNKSNYLIRPTTNLMRKTIFNWLYKYIKKLNA